MFSNEQHELGVVQELADVHLNQFKLITCDKSAEPLGLSHFQSQHQHQHQDAFGKIMPTHHCRLYTQKSWAVLDLCLILFLTQDGEEMFASAANCIKFSDSRPLVREYKP